MTSLRILIFNFLLIGVLCEISREKTFQIFKSFIVDYLETRRFEKVILLTTNEDRNIDKKNWSNFGNILCLSLTKEVKFYIGCQSILITASVQNDSSSWTNSILFTDGTPLFIAPILTTHQLSFMEKVFISKARQQLFWLLIRNSSLPKNFTLQLNNKVSIACFDESASKVALLDTYQSVTNGFNYVNIIGHWTLEMGFFKFFGNKELNNLEVPSSINPQYKPMENADFNPLSNRRNLSEIFIRCLVIESETEVIVRNLAGDLLEVVNGPVPMAWVHLQEALGFRYEARRHQNNNYGSYDVHSKSWNGMVRALLYDKADVIIVPLHVTAERYNVIDYLFPLLREKKRIVYKKPKRSNSNSWHHYVTEFSRTLWISVVLFLIVVTWMMHFFMNHCRDEKGKSFVDSVMFSVGAACNMGTEYHFRSTSVRILIITVYLTIVVLYASYTSILIASLAVDTNVPPITNLEELYNHRDEYRFVFMQGTSHIDDFRTSRDPLNAKIYNTMIYPYLDSSLENQVESKSQLLEVGNTVMLHSHYGIDAFRSCSFFNFPLDSDSLSTIGVKKGYYLKNILNYHLFKYLEIGGLQREKRRFEVLQNWKISSPCIEEPFSAIDIGDVKSILLVFSVGCVASIIILIAEILVNGQKKLEVEK